MGRSESGGPWAFKSTKTHTASLPASSPLSFSLASSPRNPAISCSSRTPRSLGTPPSVRNALSDPWVMRETRNINILYHPRVLPLTALFGLKIGNGMRPSSPFFVVWSRLSPPPERKRPARCGITKAERRLSRYSRDNAAKSVRGCCIKCNT